jgi:hypothetical protein
VACRWGEQRRCYRNCGQRCCAYHALLHFFLAEPLPIASSRTVRDRAAAGRDVVASKLALSHELVRHATENIGGSARNLLKHLGDAPESEAVRSRRISLLSSVAGASRRCASDTVNQAPRTWFAPSKLFCPREQARFTMRHSGAFLLHCVRIRGSPELRMNRGVGIFVVYWIGDLVLEQGLVAKQHEDSVK